MPVGKVRFWAIDRVAHVNRREALRLQRWGSRSTWIWRTFPPHGSGTDAPWTVASCTRRKLMPDVVERLLGERLAAQAELKNRHVRRAVTDDERRRGAGRHHAHDRLIDRSDLRDRGVHARARLEEDFDHADAGERLRLDVLDVVYRRGHRALADRDDALFHFFGREAAVIPNHGNDRNVDRGENVLRHPATAKYPEDNDEQGHHGERVGPAKSETDDPHGELSERQLTSAPCGRQGLPLSGETRIFSNISFVRDRVV